MGTPHKVTKQLDVFYPKGSMCVACKHRGKNCSHLPFHTMSVLKSKGNLHQVKCSEFER